MSPICPCCGYDLAKDEPVTIGELSVDPVGDVVWLGNVVRLSPAERIIIHSIAKAHPGYVSRAVLLERIGSDGDGNIINVHLSRIRRKFLAAGHEAPLTNIWGTGLRWAA